MRRIMPIVVCLLLMRVAEAQDIHLFFDLNSDKLRPGDMGKLDQLAVKYQENKFQLAVKGYADSIGSSAYNAGLSKRRAIAAKEYLIQKNIKAEDIILEFYGEEEKDAMEVEYNRRVDVFVYKNIPADIKTYPELIKHLAPAPESFDIPADRAITIKGKKGTVIKIPENAFRDANGEPLSGTVKMEVTEYYSKSDLFSRRLSTISGGNLLVSGGVVDIKATKDGEEVFLDKGSTVELDFPKYNPRDTFEIFYGQRLPDGAMTWEPESTYWTPGEINFGVTVGADGRSLVVVDKTAAAKRNKELVFDRKTRTFRTMAEAEEDIKMQQDVDTLYSTLNARRLNWINCDYFYRDSTLQVVDYFVRVNNPGVSVTNVYLVFSGINSIIELYNQQDKTFRMNARLPVRRSARLLVSGTANGKFYAYLSSTKLTNGKTENVMMRETTLENFARLLQRL